MITARPVWRWIIVGCYVLALPFMRGVWNMLRTRSAVLADVLPLVIASLLVTALVVYLVQAKRERRAWVYLSLVVVCVIYAGVTFSLERPIERIHLAQYGLLSILIFWAMAHGDEGATLCLWAVLGTVELGIADEFFQGLLPPRIYDFHDVTLNAKAALLGQAVMAFVIRPWERREHRFEPRPRRSAKAARVLTACALALVLVVTVMNIHIIERGTPTIAADVHRGDGELARRDGYLYFGPGATIANAAAITAVLVIILLTRGRVKGETGFVRSVAVCGLIPPAILIVGKLLDLRFR